MLRYMFLVVGVMLLAGCTNTGLMKSMSAEDPNYKTWGCVTGEFTGTYTASKVVGGRLRVPADTDTTDWTPEQLQALIAALCAR